MSVSRNLNSLIDIPWPISTKNIPINTKSIATSCYNHKDNLLKGESQFIIMGKSAPKNNGTKVLSISGHIYHSIPKSICNVKLGIISNTFTTVNENTGNEIYDRDICYAIDRKVSENSFQENNPIEFYINEYGIINLQTNSEDVIENDVATYKTSSGSSRIPQVGDIVLRLECEEGAVEPSFTMTYKIIEF